MRGRRGIRYDWTPDIWSWRPDAERWSPEHGSAPRPVYLEASTAGIPSRETYDFWRETAYYNFDADRRDENATSSFHGHGRAILSDGLSFFSYRSDAVSGRRADRHIRADGRDGVEIGLVLDGCRRARRDDDETSIAEPGAFFVFDEARPSRMAWEAHEGLHLSLRRQAVETALGAPLPPGDTLAKALGRSRLAPMLRSQFMLIADHMDRLEPGERAFLLGQAADLALYSLGQLGLARSRGGRERAAQFTAAQRLIEQNYRDPAFSAAALVGSLGCSRATLYRAFADHGLSVAGAIRNIRLEHARRLLETSGAHLPIATVAEWCGLPDTANFNRMFREHFGMGPHEARQRACGNT